MLDEGTGMYDRTYNAYDFADFYASFFSDGVFPNPSTNLHVFAEDNFRVGVRIGSALINGHRLGLKSPISFEVDRPHATLRRIDVVVIQLNKPLRRMDILHKTGTPASAPQVPPLIRNEDIWELRLAEINVRANTSSILTSDITDTRLNNLVCGLVTGAIDTVDTQVLFDQLHAWFEEQKAEWERELRYLQEWFNSIKNDLSALTHFNFDNDFELPFTRRTTNIDGNTVTAEIRGSITNILVADRVTTIEGTQVTTTVRIYMSDGELARSTTSVTNLENNRVATDITGEGHSNLKEEVLNI